MMLRTFILALCLCGAACTAAAAKLPPAPHCRDTPARPGGWAQTSKVPSAVYAAIQVDLMESGALNATASFCDDPAAHTLAACVQVVAGRNYEVIARLSCPEVDSSVRLRAEVYLPLPTGNEEPEVTSLDILSVEGPAPEN